jgi:hypothetical protein
MALPARLNIGRPGRGILEKRAELPMDRRPPCNDFGFGRRTSSPLEAFMNLKHLHYFLAVAEEKSFTRAAARVHTKLRSIGRQYSSLTCQYFSHFFRITMV